MSDVVVMPDAKAIAIAWLKDDDRLTALGATVAGDRRRNGVYPVLTVTRAGGETPSIRAVEAARLQLDSWSDLVDRGGSGQEAFDVIAAARASLFAMPGRHALGIVTAVRDAIGPIERADLDTQRPRCLSVVTVYVKPLPS